MDLARVILWVAAAYAGVGIAFAVGFVTVGVGRVDPAARGAPVGFRLLVFPGAAVLWPWLLLKWGTAGRRKEQHP